MLDWDFALRGPDTFFKNYQKAMCWMVGGHVYMVESRKINGS